MHNKTLRRHTSNMRHTQYLVCTLLILASALIIGCQKEDDSTPTTCYISFDAEEYIFGVMDSEEWFEIPINITASAGYDRNIGVEIVASESSAIQGRDFTLESTTLPIPEGKTSTYVRLQGNPEAIATGERRTLKLRLVLDDRNINEESITECSITLQHCCPFDINDFEGYAVLTSTWCMQYMNCDSLLVHTYVEADENIVVIEDMFYEGHDIRVKLDSSDRLNPIATLCGVQTLATTGEAFGTIYGDGKLLICEAREYTSTSADLSGYVSFYSTCEEFMMLYAVMYVEGIGEVGMFGNIVEWISDDEAERIMREGL